jgi:GDP-4-dehydro-6-deoxy-D-mannose reductase
MRALVTGACGFVAPHLIDLLVENGVEVVGLSRDGDISQVTRRLSKAVPIHGGDIRSQSTLRALLQDVRPDHIYHLAGISSVARSFTDPRLTYSINVDGTLNLFECIRELNLRSRVVMVSSAMIYGSLGWQGAKGFTELSDVHPHSPYAASKIMCEQLAKHYVETFGLRVVIARPFNHIGPHQPSGYVCSDFAKQVAAICAGVAEPVLRVGNLNVHRDFSDVRDIVDAYWRLARFGQAGEVYNVCSGKARKVADVLASLCEMSGRTIDVVIDPEKFRPIDDNYVLGDPTKIRTATRWEAHTSWHKTLEDLLDCWKMQVLESAVQTAAEP